MDNRKTTKRRLVADGIVALFEVGFLIVSWVLVFVSPDDIFIRVSAYLATLIVMITLWSMTLTSEIRQLRNNNEELREICQRIQSRLLDENAELHKQHLADQQQILMLDTERKSLYLRNCQLETSWKQLEDLMKQHTLAPSDDEKNEEPSENQHLTAANESSTI
ncbi:MAG: hypothetical protein IJX67_00745 [Oscillospiraceae bacterium]|nr:hypothetical protein [Oscillospiraceae bacterium]